MKSMDEIYNSMAGQKPKRSMDEIFSQVSGGYDMNKVMSQANQPQGLPSSLTSGAGDEIIGALTDDPTTLASGVGNLLGANAKQVTNPFTGKQLPGVGYSQTGEELSPMDTAKQVGGAAIATAANVVAPGAGKGVVEASKYGLKTLLPKLARGAAVGAGTGAAQGFGAELRESQDVSDALVSGGLTGLAGGVIGAGTAGVAAKVSRNAGRIVEDLQAAKAANDFEKVSEIESSPEFVNILKANGFNDQKAVQDKINDAVVGVKKTILEEQTAMSPSKVEIRNKIRQGLYDDAIKETLADYNNYGGKLDDVQTARQAKTKQYQELREQIARDLSGTELDPFKNISAGEMKARIWDNLSDTIKRDLVEGPKARDFIGDYIDTQLAKGNSMERLDFLRMSGNQDWQKTSTGAQIQTAIANASRGAMDDIVVALEKSGANPDLIKVIKDYVELNRLYGVSKQAEELQRELGIALNKKKSINRLLNMLGGVGLGSATGNPFAFYAGAQLSDWGQRALNNTIEAGVLRNYASKISKSSGDVIKKETPDALKRIIGLDKKISQKKQAQKLIADQEAARVAEMTYTPENKLPVIQMGAGNVPQKVDNTPSIDIENLVPETPPVKPKPSLYEAYTPESELPTIDAGGTPKSKFSKSSKDLPVIKSILALAGTGAAAGTQEAKAEWRTAPKDDVQKIDEGFKKVSQGIEQKYPMIDKKYLKTLIEQESTSGKNDVNREYGQGKYGWVVGFTRSTYNDFKKRAETSQKAKALFDKLKFDTPEQAMESAMEYSQYLLRDHTKEQETSEREWKKITAGELYKMYNGGGSKTAKQDFEEKFNR